jgi:thermitase
MNKNQISKFIGLLLIAALIVSSNMAVVTAATNHASPGDRNSFGFRQQSLSTANHAGTIQNATQFNWNADALSIYADGSNSIEIIVGIDNTPTGHNRIVDLARQNGAAVTETISMGDKSAVVVKTSASAASNFVSQVHAARISNYIEPNGKYTVDSTPNDPNWTLQWGIQRVRADYAWNTTVGNDDLLVAVIDTGIDYTHPDLQANYVPLGYDFINNDNDPKDDHGHGTHCAGIIAATMNNSQGIAGTAKVKIMAEKGLSVSGSGSYTALANCIVHAVNAGADILSNSWGGAGGSSLISDAIAYATARGVLVLAAAGNENTDQLSYPAAYSDVIAVAASNTTDTRASFSNYGDWVDVAAPGVMIYSTMPTYHVTMFNEPRFTMNYSYCNGTSMACPVAAGVAALIWSRYPAMTAEFVREQLESTCDDVGAPGFDVYFGNGIVNAQRGVEQTPVEHDLEARTWIKQSYAMLNTAQSFNITVTNRGSINETDIQVSLLVNGTTVDSATIPTLSAYRSASSLLYWTPQALGIYNVTYAVTPASGESDFANNHLSANYTVVSSPNEANWTKIASHQDHGSPYVPYNVKAVYSQLQSDVVFFKVAYYRPWSNAFEDINTGIMVDVDQNISTGAPQGYYPFQSDYIGADFLILVGYEGNEVWQWDSANRRFDYDNPFNLIYLDAPDDSDTFVVGIDADTLQTTGTMDCSLSDVTPFFYDGQWWATWDWVPETGYFPFVAQPSQHDLVVTLEAPRIWTSQTSLALKAKLFNFGQTGEANVNFTLYINGENLNSTILSSVPSGEYKEVTFTYTPSTGFYNITAVALPATGESSIQNNLRTYILAVSPKIAVISENTELLPILDLLDSMYINYEVFNNREHLNPTFMSKINDYSVVLYYNDGRNITALEQSVMNAYLAWGGNLLVTGYDSLLFPDAKLADVLRVTTSGDDLGSDDLIVVEGSHPIVNGGYGTFEPGFNVTGLSIDNDAVEADTARNATTIAELSSGYDKIVATDSLPGKVVFWNGVGSQEWLNNPDCQAMFKNTLLWFLDVTPPTTTDDYDGQWHTADFTINLSAQDYFGINQTYYRINDGPTKTVAANGQPLITTDSTSNTLEYWSTDLYGHIENHHFLNQIKLDKTGPTGSLQINNGDTSTTSTAVTLTLSADDAVSGINQVRYSNDDVWDTEPWESFTATKDWTLPSGDGVKTVYYAIKNNAGLTTILSSNIILDTIPPTGSISINDEAAYTNTPTVTLTLSLTDDNSNDAMMRFSNDNAEWSNWQTYSSTATWTLQDTDGTKTVYVQFKDNAGLLSTVASAQIILDTTAPSAVAGQSRTVTPGASVTFDASGSSDANGIISYRWDFDDGSSIATGITVTHTYTSTGPYYVILTVEDPAGNKASTTITITVQASTTPTPTPTQTAPPTTSPTPTPTPTSTPPSSNNITVTGPDDSTEQFAIGGNITSAQISNAKIQVDQTAKTTILSFTITGQSGTTGYGNITIPKSQVPYGTTPQIYIDNQPAENQGYSQDADNYYVWYTVHFSTHDLSIVFTGEAQLSEDYTLLIAAVIAAVACLAVVVVVLRKHR